MIGSADPIRHELQRTYRLLRFSDPGIRGSGKGLHITARLHPPHGHRFIGVVAEVVGLEHLALRSRHAVLKMVKGALDIEGVHLIKQNRVADAMIRRIQMFHAIIVLEPYTASQILPPDMLFPLFQGVLRPIGIFFRLLPIQGHIAVPRLCQYAIQGGKLPQHLYTDRSGCGSVSRRRLEILLIADLGVPCEHTGADSIVLPEGLGQYLLHVRLDPADKVKIPGHADIV